MLSNAKALKGYKLNSLDGDIGKVKAFYFDDRHWTIRYLVAETGNWLAGRQVLISPYALVAVSSQEQHITIDLTKKQIEDSPSLNSDKPVSRQFEQAYYAYYGWPMYWSGLNAWGYYPNLVRDPKQWKHTIPGEQAWDPHLRSTDAVNGYYIQATNGEIGHIEDFIIDDETWAIRYLIIATHNWWPGKRVLLSPQWVERVSWGERKVFVNLSRETIKQAPEYDGSHPITRDYETRLHQHHRRDGYWAGNEHRKEMAHAHENGKTS
jgi:hypothetical protein